MSRRPTLQVGGWRLPVPPGQNLLLADDQAAGLILPCAACATADVVIEGPAATPLFG